MKKYLILFLFISIANSYAGPPARKFKYRKMMVILIIGYQKMVTHNI